MFHVKHRKVGMKIATGIRHFARVSYIYYCSHAYCEYFTVDNGNSIICLIEQGRIKI